MIGPDDVRRFFEERTPWMHRMLRGSFRGLYGHVLEEAIQNAHCLAFGYVLRLATLGRIGNENELIGFVRRSLHWSVVHARAGRQLHDKGRHERDVWDTMDREPFGLHIVREVVAVDDNPADAAALRIDFGAFLAGLDQRQRLILLDMLAGCGTGELAARHRLTPGRVSQLRRQFVELYEAFVAL